MSVAVDTVIEADTRGVVPRIGIAMPLGERRGGAEAALVHFLRGVREDASMIVHVCFLEPGPLVDAVADLGFNTTLIDAGRLRDVCRWLASTAKLRRWLLDNELHAVLSWLAKAHLYAGPAAFAAGVPALWFQHGVPQSRGIDLIATLLPARRVLACSKAAAEAQRHVLGHRSELRVVYPPVDLAIADAAPALAAARRSLGLPVDRMIVGIVARLQRWKGVHVFLEAAEGLVREFADLDVVVVGGEHALEAGYAAEVHGQIADPAVRSRVRFAGLQTNPAEWMAAMDVVVNASFGEPFGMVIIEAMALGKPVVATRRAGPLEIVTDGVDGLLVEPGDAAALAGALRSLLTNADLRRRLGEQARGKAARYGVPRFVAEVGQSLREVIRCRA